MTADPQMLDRSPFEVAGVLVHPELNRVDAEGEARTVEPKVMEVLLLLAEQPGEVKTRDEILDRVWADTAVTDDVLTRSVGELRRLLGDDSKNPRAIETIRKRGYRLIAPVRRLPDAARAAGPGFTGDGAAPGGAAPARAEEPTPRRREKRARERMAGRRLQWTLAASILVFVGVALWATAFRPPTADADRSHPDTPLRVLPFAAQDRLERDPAIAPDGRRIAYSRLVDDGDLSAIWIQSRPATGAPSAPVRLTDGNHPDRFPVFSPDGAELAFARDPDGDCRIVVVASTGGRERTIGPCDTRGAARFDWSPDGRTLAVSRRLGDGSRRYGIHLLDLSSGSLQQVTSPRAPFRADVEPRFSPDGRRLAFGRIAGTSVTELWTVDLDTRTESRLTRDHRDVMGQTWSRDGRTLVFSSNRAGHYGLWAVSTEGGEPRWLAGGGSKIKHPAHARDAALVAWEDWQLEINVWQLPLDGGAAPSPHGAQTPTAVARSTQWDYGPAVSPDGARLAFLSSRGGDVAVWVQDLATGEAFPVSGADQHAIAGPAFSPDGTALTWVAWQDGQPDLFVTDLTAYAPRRLTDDAAHEIAPSFARDGRTVLFGSDRSGDWNVWRIGVTDGETGAVTADGGLAAREGPDGALFLLHTVREGIWRRDAEGGEWRRIEGAPRPGHWANWEVADDGIYVLDQSGASAQLLRVPFEGGSPTRVAVLGELARPGFSIPADGRSIYASRVDRAECDLLLAENLLGPR